MNNDWMLLKGILDSFEVVKCLHHFLVAVSRCFVWAKRRIFLCSRSLGYGYICSFPSSPLSLKIILILIPSRVLDWISRLKHALPRDLAKDIFKSHLTIHKDDEADFPVPFGQG